MLRVEPHVECAECGRLRLELEETERGHEQRATVFRARGHRLPNEDAALLLLFSLVAGAQIKLRRSDAWRKIATALRQHTLCAA